jgi:hypothetical protein
MTGMYKPGPRECALLLLRLIENKEQERKGRMTRMRLSDLTLKRLWDRARLTREFLAEVEEWLLAAGWALIFAGSTFAAVKVSSVENWPRISWKRIAEELASVSRDEYDFTALEHLLVPPNEEQVVDVDDASEE